MFDTLNAEQKKAVIDEKGIFLVIAGAGSGKTRVITSRIARLIVNKNVDPHTIVALTFTNKAANEMKERIRQQLGESTGMPFLGTFHSYCLRILRNNTDILATPFEAILDSEDQKKILSDIIKRNGVGKRITAKKLSYNISQVKNNMLHKKDAVMEFFSNDRLAQELYNAYEHEKRASKCLDFDDLLIETVKLFEKNPQFQKEFQENIKHVLVDEYQDTNVVQHLLLKQMTLDTKQKVTVDSLCVVGDEDQSIYSWRGATIENIIHFKQDFKNCKLLKIEQNYRSVQQILEAANSVIKNNKKRNPKKLWSDKKGRNRIIIITCSSEYQEGDMISTFLKVASKKQNLHSIAILYRAHYQSRAIEESLIRNAIPYKIVGGIQFYERKEIKDILAYLRLVINPFDRASFFRVINCPTRGLGQKFEELFYTNWNQNLFSGFVEIAKKLIEDKALTRIKNESLQNFVAAFDNINEKMKPSKAIEQIITKTGYLTHIKNSYDKNDAESRIDNIKELIRATKFMEENNVTSISNFLEEVALMQESAHQFAQEEEKNSVTMMTLHAAKGLEFDTVIIVGVEEGILPSARSMYESDTLEEERRLFYVGITRAKERLLISRADFRYAFGQTSYQPPSRFLGEIPRKLQYEVDFCKASQNQINSTFYRWLGINQPQSTLSRVFTFGSAKKTTSSPKKSPKKIVRTGKWIKNQPVEHKKFGIGIIQKVETKNIDKIYITAKFKCGIKKIDATFLTKV